MACSNVRGEGILKAQFTQITVETHFLPGNSGICLYKHSSGFICSGFEVLSMRFLPPSWYSGAELILLCGAHSSETFYLEFKSNILLSTLY